jgi:hypothetical protein
MPLEFWSEIMSWWIVDQVTLLRTVGALVSTLFGAFVVYGARSRGTFSGDQLLVASQYGA